MNKQERQKHINNIKNILISAWNFCGSGAEEVNSYIHEHKIDRTIAEELKGEAFIKAFDEWEAMKKQMNAELKKVKKGA